MDRPILLLFCFVFSMTGWGVGQVLNKKIPAHQKLLKKKIFVRGAMGKKCFLIPRSCDYSCSSLCPPRKIHAQRIKS